MPITKSKKYIQNWQAYIVECIDIPQDEQGDNDSLVDCLKHAIARYVSEYDQWEAHRRHYPNNRDRLASWLQGIPLDFAFSYCDIIADTARLWGEKLTEKQKEAVCETWFTHCALMLERAANREGLSFFNNC